MFKKKTNFPHRFEASSLRKAHSITQLYPCQTFKALGGVLLYNESYCRHLDKHSKPDKLQLSERSLNQAKSKPEQAQISIQQSFDKDYYEQKRIEDVLLHQKEQKELEAHPISNQIMSIIEDLKYSQSAAAQFLASFKIPNQDDLESEQSFELLFGTYQSSNKRNIKSIMGKFLKIIKSKLDVQIEKFRDQEKQRMDETKVKMIDKEIQTIPNEVQKNMANLQKEIKLKNIEYETLFQYSKANLTKNDPLLNEVKQADQEQLIYKLQKQNDQKSKLIRSLKNKFNNIEDRYFKKTLELKEQKENSPLQREIKKRLQEINQVQERQKETLKTYKIFKKNLIKLRKNNKPDSRFSVISDKFKNRLNTFNDSQYRPHSLKNIEEVQKQKDFDDSDSSLEDESISKRSTQISGILKAVQKYLNKHIVRKSSWANAQKKNEKNNKKKEKKDKKRRSFRSMQSERQATGKTQRNIVKQQYEQPKKENKVPKKSSLLAPYQLLQTKEKEEGLLNRARISTISRQNSAFERSTIKQQWDQWDKTVSEIKESTAVIPADNYLKKSKKRVSFRLQSKRNHLINKICSQEVDQSYIPQVNYRSLASQPIKFSNNKKENSQSKLSKYQKNQKFQRVNLIKTSSKAKGHFRANSNLQSVSKEVDQTSYPKKIDFLRHTNSMNSYEMGRFSISINRHSLYSKPSIQQKNPSKKSSVSRQNSIYEAYPNGYHLSEAVVKRIAARCKDRQQFLYEISLRHRNCGQNCKHIQQYLKIFEKLKAKANSRPTLKLGYQNVHKHIQFENCNFDIPKNFQAVKMSSFDGSSLENIPQNCF